MDGLAVGVQLLTATTAVVIKVAIFRVPFFAVWISSPIGIDQFTAASTMTTQVPASAMGNMMIANLRFHDLPPRGE
jgi:hypothetical protein